MQTENQTLEQQETPLQESEQVAEQTTEKVAQQEAVCPETQPAEQEKVQSPKKPFYKKGLFWELAMGGLMFLVALIFIVVALNKPKQEPSSEKEGTYGEKVTSATESTLPPPEANPIGLGDFAMENGYLTCLTTPSVLGIDVSWWQKEIDWQKVKEAGVEFAMIRVGYRGSEIGVLEEDSYAKANYEGATAAGIKVGVYFFSQSISTEEAVEEAEYVVELIKDWKVEMPVVYDWEFINEDDRTGDMDPRTLTDCTKAFCDRIAQAGYQPMVYFNRNHSLYNVYIRELTEYPFWLASYDTVLVYPYKVDMWQYTETGSVPGISGNVDINLYFPWDTLQ